MTYSGERRPYGGGGQRTGTGRPSGPGGPRRFGFGRGRKACTFCIEKVQVIDYKSVNRLRRYLSDRARIESGRRTGTCARHQRMLRLAIKRARIMGLLPFDTGHLRVTGPVNTGRPGQPAPAEVEVVESAVLVEESEEGLEDVSDNDGDAEQVGKERS